eukprot:1148104-Pelagomonas_calceolata.AAC.6
MAEHSTLKICQGQCSVEALQAYRQLWKHAFCYLNSCGWTDLLVSQKQALIDIVSAVYRPGYVILRNITPQAYRQLWKHAFCYLNSCGWIDLLVSQKQALIDIVSA